MEDRKNLPMSKNPAKYKFIRRTFREDQSDPAQKLITYIKMRRIYLKKVTEAFLRKKNMEWFSFSTKKQLNCLTDFESPLNFGPHESKVVKHLKNLKNINIDIQSGCSIKLIIRFFKQISKNIKTITLSGGIFKANGTEIQSFYKNLSSLRKLINLETEVRFIKTKNTERQENTNLTVIEYTSINKYIPRLSLLKEFTLNDSRADSQGIERFMSRGLQCPSVTALTRGLQEDSFDDLGKEGQEEKSTIPPLLRFYLFPSLRRLNIYMHGTEISLSPSISQAFKSLILLKEFTLGISNRFEVVTFLFEGLFHLPLLDVFCLSIPYIENDEELLLIESLQRQTQLVSLTLLIPGEMPSRERFEQQNHNLEIICQSISGMSRLNYLHLDGSAWSLESLSRGLSHVELTNQLKELRIGVFEDISILSSGDPGNKVEGLCDFIERQRSSLRVLWIRLACVKEDEILDSLIRAIGGATKLESLHLEVNVTYNKSSLEKNELLEDVPRESLEGCPSFNHTVVCLKQVLLQLKELTDLTLYLRPLLLPFEVPMIKSSMIFNALFSLKHLKSLELCLPFLRESFMIHPEQLLQQLAKMDNLTEWYVRTVSDIDDYIEEIGEVWKQTEQQRYFRKNLAF